MQGGDTDRQKIVHTIDLKFLGMTGVIASYLIPHRNGVLLVESGPGSTVPALQEGLADLGYRPQDVTDVLLTHIHLDHAGASGWLALHGATIHVHPVGAPHMQNPEKLLTSAKRIYGDMMDTLWGEFIPVPEDKLHIVEDKEEIEIEDICFRALATPGHAEHHHAYLFKDILFSGDVGGVRLQETRHLRLPMPPPEFHLERWKASAERITSAYQRGHFERIAPTHFGIFSDAGWHLQALERSLEEIGAWIESIMEDNPSVERINDTFAEWTRERSLAADISEELLQAYEAANPSWMSGFGIQRYWQKHRSG
jgi:glyoxylase-like metal-dependent hydrolase (beta-lactamase superfamily II)